MEEAAPSRASVAELAGRFKVSASPHNAAGNEAEKRVRRRPPCSLQLSKTHGEDQEPPGVTSPLPAKTKRNSALIEKLQASLVLSPTAQMPSPKSPGFRLLPPTFPASSSSSAPVTTETTSTTATPITPVAASPSTEEEGPTSFDDPPTAAEGSILSNVNKNRARHSIRRRPPSRRHRKSSSGDEVGVTNDTADKTTAVGGGGEKEEAGEEELKEEGETDASTCPETNQSHKEDQSDTEPRDEDQKKEEEGEEGERGSGIMGGQDGDRCSSGGKEEEEEEKKNSGETLKEDLTEEATHTDSREEEMNEPEQEAMCQSSAR